MAEEKNEKEKNPEEIIEVSRKEYDTLLSTLKELEGMKDKLLRSAADYENAKKRLTRERDEFVRFNQERFIRELLPVLDNFERALDHAEDAQEQAGKGIVSGIQMVLKQFNEILKMQGVKRLETAGQVFDPHLHEAVGYVQEEGKPDEIVQELQPGYLLHDRLLRAAKVRVRIAPAAESSPQTPSKEDEELT